MNDIIKGLIVTVCGGIIVVCFEHGYIPLPFQQKSPTYKAEDSHAHISFPLMNSVVKNRQPIMGTISGLSINKYYFLIIQSQNFGNLYYPQQEVFSTTWKTLGRYGSKTQKYGYKYDTFIVETSENEDAQFIRKKMGKGLKNLPIHTKVISNQITTICCD